MKKVIFAVCCLFAFSVTTGSFVLAGSQEDMKKESEIAVEQVKEVTGQAVNEGQVAAENVDENIEQAENNAGQDEKAMENMDKKGEEVAK